MVVCTFCPLIIPFLALSSVTGIHPVQGPVSGELTMPMVGSISNIDPRPHYASLFRIRWDEPEWSR
jgi:hypothetical protein